MQQQGNILFTKKQIGKTRHEKNFFSRNAIGGFITRATTQLKQTLKAQPLIGYGILSSFLIFGLLSFDDSDLLKGSITSSPVKFEGTTLPFQHAPNWFKTGGKNDKNFSDYAKSDLVPAPEYDPKNMQRDVWEQKTVNQKITYSIVYSGQYKYNHIELKGSHPGVDIKLPTGTPIVSIANGVVEKAIDKTTGYGKHVVIRHDNVPKYGTLYSSYSHMSKIGVKTGQIVKKGQKIGEVGSTGTSTTPHIHFQVDKKSAPFHPYWPFTGTEAKNAGHSFYEAVNAGFKQENVLTHTVNPMTFIKEFQNYKSSGSSNASESTHGSAPEKNTKTEVEETITKPTPTPVTEPVLERLLVETTPATVESGSKVLVSIEARDKEMQIDRDISGMATIIFKDGNKSVEKEVEIKRGKGREKFVLENTGKTAFTIRFKDKKIKKNVVVIEQKSDNIELKNEEKEVENTPKPTPKPKIKKQEFSHFKIEGKNKAVIGEKINLVVYPVDKNGEHIKNYVLPNTYGIQTEKGDIQPKNLIQSNNLGGKFSFIFTPTKSGMGGIEVLESRYRVTVSEPVEQIFSDVNQNHSNATAIEYLKKNKIIDGYKDGSFKPEKTVTRAEAIKMIFSALEIEGGTEISNPFSDVTSSDWYSNYVLAALDLDIVKGYSDGTFLPNKTVTRAEYFKIFLNSADIPVDENVSENPFTDTSKDEWFAPFALAAKEENLLDFNGKYEAGKPITRAEVAETIYRLIK